MCITEADAKLVSRKTKKLSRLCQLGNQQGTRKKPHAIDVALEQSIQHNCWYTMWMEIYTMPTYGI